MKNDKFAAAIFVLAILFIVTGVMLHTAYASGDDFVPMINTTK